MSLFGRSRIIWRNSGNQLKQYCTGKQGPASTAKSQSSTGVKADVPGLSSNCVHVTNAEVGPGASKAGNYKNPEYFSFHTFSYFEAEIEMAKYRCPQPSPFKKEIKSALGGNSAYVRVASCFSSTNNKKRKSQHVMIINTHNQLYNGPLSTYCPLVMKNVSS